MGGVVNPQPQPGDVLLGCEHRPNPHASHVFKLLKGMKFTRPDGTSSNASWIFICDACFEKYVVDAGGLATDAPLACDMTWTSSHAPLTFRKPS